MPSDARRQQTRRENRHLKFYELRDNPLVGVVDQSGVWTAPRTEGTQKRP